VFAAAARWSAPEGGSRRLVPRLAVGVSGIAFTLTIFAWLRPLWWVKVSLILVAGLPWVRLTVMAIASPPLRCWTLWCW